MVKQEAYFIPGMPDPHYFFVSTFPNEVQFKLNKIEFDYCEMKEKYIFDNLRIQLFDHTITKLMEMQH